MRGWRIGRREFVEIVAGGLFSTCLPGCAALAATTVRSERGELQLRLAEHPELTAAYGILRIRTEATGELLYVLRPEDGSYVALSPICTHQGCTVQVAGQYLECPCHGSIYTLEGLVVRGPAEAPLRRLPARVADDVVLIIQTGDVR